MPILTLLKTRRASATAVILFTAAAILLSTSPTLSFLHQRTHQKIIITTTHSPLSPPLQMAKSYGPQDAEIISSNNNNNNPNKNIKAEFATLLTTVVAYSSSNQPEQLPSLLASNIDMILMAMNTNGLIEQVIQEDIQQQQQGTTSNNSNNSNNNGDRLEELSSAVNLILSFVETFVEEAQSMEDVYKQLMGKIFAVITPNSNQQGSSSSETSTTTTAASTSIGEAALEELLSNESEAFTPGFLRHIEGECNRLASLPTISPQSSKLLEILRIIQTRILEELGRGSIGEGAIVIGQLLGYDDTKERLAVLDAGLAVRGVEFARELKGLTSEALGGFQNVQKKQQQQQGGAGGVDPGLVRSVEEIDERIQQFIDKSSSFQ